jgi:hypothetical protein
LPFLQGKHGLLQLLHLQNHNFQNFTFGLKSSFQLFLPFSFTIFSAFTGKMPGKSSLVGSFWLGWNNPVQSWIKIENAINADPALH